MAFLGSGTSFDITNNVLPSPRHHTSFFYQMLYEMYGLLGGFLATLPFTVDYLASGTVIYLCS